jgi:hypothetical protein
MSSGYFEDIEVADSQKAGPSGEVTLKYWRHFEGDKSITNRFRLRLHTQQ